MKCILDTHFLIWILSNSTRLKSYRWLDRYRPWGLSPISLLEMQFLAECGKIQLNTEAFLPLLSQDPRFLLDDIPSHALILSSLELAWTRDPFDRLLAAHSLARRLPLCSVDQHILDNHRLVPKETVL
ncbi:MAG: PIN domain-containing protein [Candidatus Eremiobacteraeota bacterium]|nr:PIN domain-containing protein [Candidatus Eremiobacteraeota bacterium]MCW5866307.1 PIN domain-containing protein [Candidatus Eremiobacteraeota bacterium]